MLTGLDGESREFLFPYYKYLDPNNVPECVYLPSSKFLIVMMRACTFVKDPEECVY